MIVYFVLIQQLVRLDFLRNGKSSVGSTVWFLSHVFCFFFIKKNKLGEKKIKMLFLPKIHWISRNTLNFFKVNLNRKKLIASATFVTLYVKC